MTYKNVRFRNYQIVLCCRSKKNQKKKMSQLSQYCYFLLKNIYMCVEDDIEERMQTNLHNVLYKIYLS